MTAVGGGFLQMLNPVAAFAYMARLGADYAIAVGAIAALGLADLGVGLLAGVAEPDRGTPPVGLGRR